MLLRLTHQPWLNKVQDQAAYFRFLHAYKYSISSTQLARLMGISAYGSRSQFWHYKMGLKEEPEASPHAQFGIHQEPITAQLFMDRIGNKAGFDMVHNPGTMVYPDVDLVEPPFYLCASPDRILVNTHTNESIGLEIKNRTPDAKERIPTWPLVEHYTQLLQTMACWGWSRMWIVYAINEEKRLKVFEVKYSPDVFGICLGYVQGYIDCIKYSKDPGSMKPGAKKNIVDMLQQALEADCKVVYDLSIWD